MLKNPDVGNLSDKEINQLEQELGIDRATRVQWNRTSPNQVPKKDKRNSKYVTTEEMYDMSGLTREERQKFETLIDDRVALKLREQIDQTFKTSASMSIQHIWQAQAIKTLASALMFASSIRVEQKISLAMPKPILNSDTVNDTIELLPFLEEADVYLWTQDAFDLSMTMPDPERVLVDKGILTTPSMFMVFENPRYFVGRVTETDKSGEVSSTECPYEVSWICATDAGEELLIIYDLMPISTRKEYVDSMKHTGHPPTIVNNGWMTTISIPYNSIYPDQIFSKHLEEGVNELDTVIKMLLFLQTKAATIERRNTERSMKRTLKREGYSVNEKESRVITLRKVSYKGMVVPTGDGSKKTINWAGRWWVQGHWHKYAYGPKKSLRRTQWIETYAKGPEDKAFIEKTYMVTR